MDDQVDALAVHTGEQSDRRGMFKAAAGGALGLLGVAALSEDVFAKKCKNNKDCPSNKKCKNKKKQNNGKRRGRCK